MQLFANRRARFSVCEEHRFKILGHRMPAIRLVSEFLVGHLGVDCVFSRMSHGVAGILGANSGRLVVMEVQRERYDRYSCADGDDSADNLQDHSKGSESAETSSNGRRHRFSKLWGRAGYGGTASVSDRSYRYCFGL